MLILSSSYHNAENCISLVRQYGSDSSCVCMFQVVIFWQVITIETDMYLTDFCKQLLQGPAIGWTGHQAQNDLCAICWKDTVSPFNMHYGSDPPLRKIKQKFHSTFQIKTNKHHCCSKFCLSVFVFHPFCMFEKLWSVIIYFQHICLSPES